jgi:hypothetical protein
MEMIKLNEKYISHFEMENSSLFSTTNVEWEICEQAQ